MISFFFLFFFQAEDGIRDLVRSRGLGDVYKRQAQVLAALAAFVGAVKGSLSMVGTGLSAGSRRSMTVSYTHLTLPTIYSV